MLNRRRTLQGSLAAAGALVFAKPGIIRAQSKGPMKVRYSEVVRSFLYGPAYAAITNGYFKEAGLDVELSTANGGDKAMALLLAGGADISLMGPEVPIYVLNSDSPVKVRIFCGLTTTSGDMLVGRQKVDKFDWSTLKGKEFLGFRPGSTPLLFLEAAMRQNGVDPLKDVKLNNNVAIPARLGSWLAGQNQFAIVNEPDAAQLELDAKGFVMASVGETVGEADYTSFMATDTYIKANPQILQLWTNAITKAMAWCDKSPTADIVKALTPFFPSMSAEAMTVAAARYKKLKLWKSMPVIEEKPIEKFQDILVAGRVLEQGKRVKFADLINNDFTRNAK